MRPRNAGIRLAELVDIRLGLKRPLDGRADPRERHRSGGRALWAGVGRALGLRRVSRVRGTSEPGDEAADSPSRVGVAQGLNLAPELHTIGLGFAPPADQVGDIWGQHPRRRPPLESSAAGRRVSPEVGVDRRAADAQPARNGGQRHPLRLERVHSLIDRDPAGVLGGPCGFLPQLRRLGALAPSPVHGHDGERTIGLGERHRRAGRGGMERRSAVEQQGFQGLAEVMDQLGWRTPWRCGTGHPPPRPLGCLWPRYRSPTGEAETSRKATPTPFLRKPLLTMKLSTANCGPSSLL